MSLKKAVKLLKKERNNNHPTNEGIQVEFMHHIHLKRNWANYGHHPSYTIPYNSKTN